MAETLVSPGVLARENDQSFISAQPTQAGAALVGPTVKGKVGIPKLVTTYSEYKSAFGSTFISGSNEYTFFTSISAYNYFNNGGDTLLVTRVATGSWSPATSEISGSDSVTAFTLETLSEGEEQNSIGPLDPSGSLASGSAENVRWEISSPNSESGVFSVIIRQGNDNTKQKITLETYMNVSLDPTADNYVAKSIGDTTEVIRTDTDGTPYVQVTGSYANLSRYVRVSAVNTPTPNYFDNTGLPKPEYTSSIPVEGSGSLGGAFDNATGTNINTGMNFYQEINNTNTQGLQGFMYTQSLQLLSNQDDYRFNMITTPGLCYGFASHVSAINTMMNQSQNRGDNISIIDTDGYNAQINGPITTAGSIDSSYAATYWPWCQIMDPDSGQLCWVPASTLIPGVYAYNDTRSEPWFAPAGINRGGLSTVSRVERKLTQNNRDSLYTANVNPIATFPNTGIVVFGQKTLQTKASALDRVNVRRLLIALKSHISQVADQLVFEQNSIATRNSFLSQVNPYLESVQQRQGLYAFKVVMDTSNNTPDVIDRNELVGAIYLQPTKTAEFIILDFNVMPTGATFPS